ncbi:hypothetical protein ABEB36_009118 [Hypothenemus hampei]|uniref:Uncharacterized protein n=1 Tax=Hypothenemus hampei TaxID=57062 RepID=A0ABD1EP82_HYPHA
MKRIHQVPLLKKNVLLGLKFISSIPKFLLLFSTHIRFSFGVFPIYSDIESSLDHRVITFILWFVANSHNVVDPALNIPINIPWFAFNYSLSLVILFLTLKNHFLIFSFIQFMFSSIHDILLYFISLDAITSFPICISFFAIKKFPEITITENDLPISVGCGKQFCISVFLPNKYLCIKVNSDGGRHSFHFVASSVP